MSKFDRYIPWLGHNFIRTLRATLRIRQVRLENIEGLNRQGKHYILTLWHAHILMLTYAEFSRPMTALISQHRDGELIAKLVERMGVSAARGSSTRGGREALREMIRVSKSSNLAFTPDGPKGPARIAKVGVVIAAQKTGLPIMPAVFVAEKRKKLRSWDQFEVPYPFSRAIYVYGKPIYIPARLDSDELEQYRQLVENTLNDLTNEAEQNFDALYKG